MPSNSSVVNSNNSTAAVTGLILAGGRATRMGNCDKGLQQFNGKTMIEHVISRFAPQVSTLIINANRNLTEYAQFGFPVHSDVGDSPSAEPDYAGPLAGLKVGLTHCKTPYMITVPCDAPFLPKDLVERLMTALQQQQADIAIAYASEISAGEINKPRAQPVFCLVKKMLLEQLNQYLTNGGRRMDGWYGESTVAKVYFEDEAEFRNINTLEELRACS